MHRTLRSLLLLSATLVALALVLPKTVYASPGLVPPYNSSPTNHVMTGSISNPGNAYDLSNATYADWYVGAAAITGLEVRNFSITGAPTTEGIGIVDFKMNYYFEGGSDDNYRILYYVSPSSTLTVLQDWSAVAKAASTVVWGSQPEPNDGVWSWTDIQNIRFVVEGTPGADGRSQRTDFFEYEAWVSVYSYTLSTVYVNPASQTDPASPFSVNIDIQNVEDLYGWEFKLYYNTTILSGSSVTEGTFLSSVGTTSFFVIDNTDSYNATHGRFWATCTLTGMTAGKTGSGTLATISLTVDGPGGTTPLDLVDTKLIGHEIWGHRMTYMGHTATDGSVTITGVVVPEFPFGIALEIGLVGAIVYVWWRGKKKPPAKLTNIVS